MECRKAERTLMRVPGSSRRRARHGSPGVADAKLVEQAARERVLVAGRKRPRRGVLRAQRAGGHAAAVGERRHRE